MFEKHPPHVRKKIALIVTLFVALVLVVVLVVAYASPRRDDRGEEPGALADFYRQIQTSGESLFGAK